MVAALARRLPFFYGWLIVAVVFVTMAIGVNARTAFSLLFPPILAEYGWQQGATAGAFSFGFLVSAALSPLLGRLMDRKGPVWVMELGTLAIVLGLFLATYASQPWHLYLTLGVLVGAGSVATGYTGQALYLPSWFVRHRGLAISIGYAGAGGGSIVLMPWVQHLIAVSGWRSACIALSLLALLLLAPLNLLLRRRPEDLGLAPDGDRAGGPVRRRALEVVDPAWVAIDWTLARALRTARFWWVALGSFAALFAWYAVQVHQTKYLIGIGFSPETAAWALGVVSLAGIPGQIAMGALSDRIGREPVWATGCLGFVLTYLLLIALGRWPSAALLWAMVLAQGVLGYGVTSVLSAITAEIFEGKQFGAIFGTVMLGAIMGGAAGPFVVGVLHDHTGSDMPGFIVALAFSAFSALAIYIAAPRKVRRIVRSLP
jgi:MFS family permease